MNSTREELISIIVPVYNVEKYLKRCVESIFAQNYKNMEIILVDDGSTDKSGEIADYLSGKDVRVFSYHKENGGLSDARNFGIEKANGKYITFIDSDDWVSPDFISTLYHNLKKYSAEISGCLFRRTRGDSIWEKNEEKPKVAVWSSTEALRKMLRQEEGFTTSACALLYDIKCFENIRYPKGKYFEDLGTTYKLLSKINRMVHTNRCLYHYYMRDGSIANACFKAEYMDEYYFAREIIDFVKTNYEELLLDAQSRLVGVCFHLYMMIDKEHLREYKECRNILIHTIKENRVRMILNKETPVKVRMGCIVSFFGMTVTRGVYQGFHIKGKNNCI